MENTSHQIDNIKPLTTKYVEVDFVQKYIKSEKLMPGGPNWKINVGSSRVLDNSFVKKSVRKSNGR